MSNFSTLPGIIKLEYTQADLLTLYPKKHISPGVDISAIGSFQELDLVGQANSSTSTERTNTGLIYNSKVSGVIYESDDFNEETINLLIEQYYCYRLTDVYGVQYLVGANSRPYPEITFTPMNDSVRAIQFEISWITTVPPLKLTSL